jgi:hypothetical protein
MPLVLILGSLLLPIPLSRMLLSCASALKVSRGSPLKKSLILPPPEVREIGERDETLLDIACLYARYPRSVTIGDRPQFAGKCLLG